MFVGVVDVGIITSQRTHRSLVKVFADSAVENVREVRMNRVEDLMVNTKVLSENISGGVVNPVVDHEGSFSKSVY